MAKKHSSAREHNRASGTDGSATAAAHDAPLGTSAGSRLESSETASQPALAQLTEQLRAGRVVLCAGANFLASAGRPSWRGVVAKLLDRLAADPAMDQAELSEARGLLDSHPMAVSGFARRQLGEGFPAALAEAVGSDESIPDLAALSSRLPFRAVLSTATDDLLTRAFTKEGAQPQSVTPASSEEVRREGRTRYVMRLMGDSALPDSVVFSSSDWQRVLGNDAFRHLLRDLYTKRSFLFVGFDPRDPDFELLLVRALGSLVDAGEPNLPPHFALLPSTPKVVQQELAAAYGLRLLDASDEAGLVQTLHEAVGDSAGEALPDDDDLEGWLRLLGQEPGRQDALDKLAALDEKLTAADDTDRLIELCLGRTEIEASPAGRAQALRRLAGLFEHKKGQIAEAFQTLLAAYKEIPETTLLDEVERLAGLGGFWVELLTELREQIPLLPMAERPQVWLRVARLYGEKLSHLEYALASVAEAQKLITADSSTQVKHELYALRVELARRAEKWKDLAEALTQLADAQPDKEKQLDLFLELGEVYESRLSDSAAATAAFKKARAAAPTSRDAMSALEHALRRQANWTGLIELLDEKVAMLEKSGDASSALRFRREAAQLHTEHGKDRKASIERWEAVQALAATDLDTLRALEKLYSQEGGQSERYLQVLTALADHVSSDKERLSLYRRLVAEYEEMPGHSAQAAACLEKIVRIDTGADDAYRGLERIYRQDKQWAQLAETYEKHAEHAQSGKADLLTALAKVCETELQELPRALTSWRKVLDVSPDNTTAIEALARLSQGSESYVDAVQLLLKRAHLTDDKAAKVALYNEAARLCATKMDDEKAAEEHYVRALEIDPVHVGTIAALADMYQKRGERLRAAKLYREAEQNSSNRLDKIRYLTEAAKQHVALEEMDRALELLRAALNIDPEAVEAATQAVELYWHEGRLEDAMPLLEMLARKDAAKEVQVVRLCRLGQAALKVSYRDKALKAYTRAVELIPTDLQALRGQIPLLFEAGQFVDAKHGCETALREHRELLGAKEQAELLSLLGASEHRLSHDEAAQSALRQALELDPLHRQSLRTLRQIETLDPAQKLSCRQALLKSLQSPEAMAESGSQEERLKLLTEIGDLYAGVLSDPQAALASYAQGLELQPNSPTLMHKQFEVVCAQGQWKEAVPILDKLFAVEKSTMRKARFKQTAALICRDQLQDLPQALQYFHAALDEDATLAKCMDAIVDLATKLDSPREQVKAYQRKIKLMGPDTGDTPKLRAERLRLWTEIARLCIQRLGDLQTGMAAFEVTVALDPQNQDRLRQLAAIYATAGGDKLDKAIAQHHTILGRNKAALESYLALKDLYAQTGQRDKSAAVAYALHILRRSTPEDMQLIEEMKARQLTPAKRPLSKELWRLLTHPEEDTRLGGLFQLLWPLTQAAQAKSWTALGLDRKSQVETSSTQFFAKALRYGIEMMDAPAPALFPRPEAEDMVEIPFRINVALDRGAGATAPTVCVELGAPLLNPRRPEREVMYEIGRLAALLRPERAIRALYPTEAQLGVVIDAVTLLGTDATHPVGKVGEMATGFLRSLAAPTLEQVRRIGRSLHADKLSGEAMAATWLGASDLTAVRAGLVLCADLETAALQLATDPPGITPLSPRQRLLELIHFTVTEEYFSLRQHLGL